MSTLRKDLCQVKNYSSYLADYWQAHLADKLSFAPTVISTFAGAGGSSLGYSIAGYRELLAVEWDENAVETFKLNFHGVPVYHGDIAKLSVSECLKLAGIKAGELDVFDGSPPCQGFSTSGKRMIDDPRNQLFREYIRLLRGIQPKVFVMENVSGMIKGKMKLIFSEIMRELKASGYNVSARLLNAKWFGVPQSRERIIFIGVRSDLNIQPSHPLPTHDLITVRQAISDCNKEDDVFAKPMKGEVAGMMRLCLPGKSLAQTFKTSKYFNWVKADWDKPVMTIPKSTTYSGFTIWHPEENRCLTGIELKRLGGWPDEFKFIGSYINWVNRIGNSVPPPFMRAVAAYVKEKILKK